MISSMSDEFTEYALNLAATNIVLLVGIYKEAKGDYIQSAEDFGSVPKQK